MEKDEFGRRLKSAIESAIMEAEKAHDMSLPRGILIDFLKNRYFTTEEAIDALYLDSDHTFRVIDVVVRKLEGNMTIIFIRPSSHQPSQLFWDSPPRTGPFKVMVPSNKPRKSDIEHHDLMAPP